MTGSSGRANPSPRWIRFIPIRYQQWDPLALQATWGESRDPASCPSRGSAEVGGLRFPVGPTGLSPSRDQVDRG
ncbi:unnamed protein product [Musa hybrid cultivar]